MKAQTLVKKYLPQNPDIEVLVPNYKEPILPVKITEAFGWYGLMAYNEQGQLMCHECGAFRYSLARHIRKHGLNPREYKDKYGLLRGTKLVSDKLSQEHRNSIYKHPETIAKGSECLRKNHKAGSTRPHSIEAQNLAYSCRGQLITRLLQFAEKYGDNVTVAQIRATEQALVNLLIDRFGSFNKAKQIAKLIINEKPKFPKHLILNDMITFYNSEGHWPTQKDYVNKLLICRPSVLYINGGLITLRKEAQELRKEQEEARIWGEGLPRLAEKIEMESAGCARR